MDFVLTGKVAVHVDRLPALCGLIVVTLLLLSTGCTSLERPEAPVKPVLEKPATTRPAAPPASEATEAAPSLPKNQTPPPSKPSAAASTKLPASQPPTPTKPEGVAAAPLNLTELEQRLKQTKAIGVFTKLTLKNQVDDLLNQFRAYYQGRLKISLADLRQPYNSLILKVLALLQDGDPQLARDLVASREAIWGILADPKKFSTL